MLGPLCALLSSFTWAIGVSAYSRLSRQFAPSTVNFSRALVALPLFIAVALLAEAPTIQQGIANFRALSWQNTAWLLASVIGSYAFGDVLFLKSVSRIGVPAALAIASSYPFWSALAGWLFRGETLSLPRGIGLVLVVMGTILVILCGRPAVAKSQETKIKSIENTPAARPLSDGSRSYAIGLMLALFASFLWAMNAICSAQGGRDLTSCVSNSIRLAGAFVLCPLIGLAMNRRDPGGQLNVTIPWPSFRKYLWVFVLEGFGGAFLFVYGLTHSPLAVGAALSSLAPVISVPIALFLGTEPFSLPKTGGVCMVVLGIWLLVG